MNHPGGARLNAGPAETDSLLQTLLWVCSRYGVEKSTASFLAGMPSMDRLSVEHGIRAMQAAGFSVKLAKREPQKYRRVNSETCSRATSAWQRQSPEESVGYTVH